VYRYGSDDIALRCDPGQPARGSPGYTQQGRLFLWNSMLVGNVFRRQLSGKHEKHTCIDGDRSDREYSIVSFQASVTKNIQRLTTKLDVQTKDSDENWNNRAYMFLFIHLKGRNDKTVKQGRNTKYVILKT